MLDDIAIGVTSAAISAAAYHLAWRWGLPILRGYLRRVPDLDGSKWLKRSTGAQDRFSTVMTISQRGSTIIATGERTETRSTRTYQYRGDIRGGDIVLTWEDERAPNYMFGAMVLHLSKNLDELSGCSTYFDVKKGQVVSTHRTYDLMH